MRRLASTAATAALVIAAMGLGRLITDHVPLDHSADQPFTHTAEAGETVALEYAEVTVTGIHVTPTINGDPAAAAGGRWLVVDTELVATREPTTVLGFFLLDAQDRRYASSSRGSDCSINAGLATGVRWYGSFCFDVPQAALEGTRLVVTRGDHAVNGSGFRRDDIADIDLQIEPGDIESLWEQTEPVNVAPHGVTHPEPATP
jgi:hypothetical protein